MAWDAKLYDQNHAFVWKYGANLLELVTAPAGSRVLDLGCGTGHLTAALAARGYTVLGVDASESMIAQARQTYPELAFEVQDARNLNVGNEAWDVVFSNATLHWIPQTEMHRVAQGVVAALRNGGLMVMEMGGRGNVQNLIAAVQESLSALGCPRWHHPWFFPSIAECSAIWEQAGCEIQFARLWDRPTPLEGPEGINQWARMFAPDVIADLPSDTRNAWDTTLQTYARTRSSLWHAEGETGSAQWFADYRRLTMVGTKVAGNIKPVGPG